MQDIQALQQEIDELGAPLTERRRQLLTEALSKRTRHFTMVLEDLRDPHNISAVIRTAEVFGLQDVHIIEEENPYKINKSILKGSFKWLNLYRYKKRQLAMETLRAQGYRIAVASTNHSVPITDLDLSIPTAFYLGSEFRGNHPDTLQGADVAFILPQYGITESMNVSVASGSLMTYLDVFMRQKGRDFYQIPELDRLKLLRDWYARSRFGTNHNSPLMDVHEGGMVPGEAEIEPSA
jgi:tRNA (guanosine-2'-O-)-methyltransferase